MSLIQDLVNQNNELYGPLIDPTLDGETSRQFGSYQDLEQAVLKVLKIFPWNEINYITPDEAKLGFRTWVGVEDSSKRHVEVVVPSKWRLPLETINNLNTYALTCMRTVNGNIHGFFSVVVD